MKHLKHISMHNHAWPRHHLDQFDATNSDTYSYETLRRKIGKVLKKSQIVPSFTIMPNLYIAILCQDTKLHYWMPLTTKSVTAVWKTERQRLTIFWEGLRCKEELVMHKCLKKWRPCTIEPMFFTLMLLNLAKLPTNLMGSKSVLFEEKVNQWIT